MPSQHREGITPVPQLPQPPRRDSYVDELEGELDRLSKQLSQRGHELSQSRAQREQLEARLEEAGALAQSAVEGIASVVGPAPGAVEVTGRYAAEPPAPLQLPVLLQSLRESLRCGALKRSARSYTYTHTHLYARTLYTHTHTHIIHIHIHIHMHIHIHIHIRIHIHIIYV